MELLQNATITQRTSAPKPNRDHINKKEADTTVLNTASRQEHLHDLSSESMYEYQVELPLRQDESESKQEPELRVGSTKTDNTKVEEVSSQNSPEEKPQAENNNSVLVTSDKNDQALASKSATTFNITSETVSIRYSA